MNKCTFDPSWLQGGMFHCPQCGDMVLAGRLHPDWTVLNAAFDDIKRGTDPISEQNLS